VRELTARRTGLRELPGDRGLAPVSGKLYKGGLRLPIGEGVALGERARVRIDELGLELTVRRLDEHGQAPAGGGADTEGRMELVARFAGGVAHELNNLLTAIAGYNELILSRMSESNPLRRDAAEIERAVDRAGELARQLLAVAGRQVDRMATIDVNVLVSRLEPRLRELAGDVELTVARGTGLPSVRASADQLEEVVALLVQAAVAAGGGAVRVETSAAPGDEAGVTIVVRDTGPPLDPDRIDQVFEPFAGAATAGRGTGLELAAAYGLVAQNGGQLEAANLPGGGVGFAVRLPAAGRAEQPGSARGTARETILLAEDEEVVREIVRETLERHGYVVRTAQDGRQAIELASAGEPIDLLLSDVAMPGMSGVELADRLRATTPGLRVLYMSGSPEAEVVQDMEANGSTGFLQKPATPSAILAGVREALDA
jgi:signal transduction histidine kinase/CheY-like chemotaxis protein